MRVLQLFIVCGLIGLCLSQSAESQSQLSTSVQSIPMVKAWMREYPLTTDTVGWIMFDIVLEIPPDHHGYLDQGDAGLFIPLSFSFSALEAQGIHVEMVSRPSGIRDAKVEATILRGRNDFAFRFPRSQQISSINFPVLAKLRYQICNEVTNVCFPPRDSAIPLRFTHSLDIQR